MVVSLMRPELPDVQEIGTDAPIVHRNINAGSHALVA